MGRGILRAARRQGRGGHEDAGHGIQYRVRDAVSHTLRDPIGNSLSHSIIHAITDGFGDSLCYTIVYPQCNSVYDPLGDTVPIGDHECDSVGHAFPISHSVPLCDTVRDAFRHGVSLRYPERNTLGNVVSECDAQRNTIRNGKRNLFGYTVVNTITDAVRDAFPERDPIGHSVGYTVAQCHGQFHAIGYVIRDSIGYAVSHSIPSH